MIILFVAMSLLVAICITSGFMIFFDKVKTDLISFWVIGMSKDSVMKLLFIFTQVLSLGFILLGLLIGFGVLKAIDSKSLGFMPDIFVEQNIPISVNFADILIAFFVPYIISTLFSYYSFVTFKSENTSFLKLIRSVS
jgi:lipoprotein-releasing system permease protein